MTRERKGEIREAVRERLLTEAKTIIHEMELKGLPYGDYVDAQFALLIGMGETMTKTYEFLKE